MPACWNDHMTRPEQSKALGPDPPHEYGEPMRLRAAWMMVDAAGVPPGATSPGGMTGASPGAGGTASGGRAPGGAGAAKMLGSACGGNGAGAGTGGAGGTAASAWRWFGVSAWY